MPKKTNSIFPTINKQKYSKLNEFSFLKRSGLIIKKEDIDTKTLGELKNDLTLKAVVHKDYAKFAPKVKAYMENKKYMYIPPFWARENIGVPPKNLIKDGVPFTSELKTIYPPRDYQLPFLDKAMNQMNEIGGAVLTAKCAFGKTFCAIYLATLLKQKTLILVHNTVLLDQWIDRISYFCPEAKIGKIKGKSFEVEGKDFVIGMLQTVVREDRGYTNETFKDFGFVVSDECHHISSPMFSKALPIISTKYKLGLSATPQRNDRLENIFFWWLGPMIEVNLKVEKPYTLVKVVNYYDDDFEEKKTWTGGFNLAEMTEDIINNQKRNEFIIKNTRHYAKLGRQVLVLSTRRSHLELLKQMFESKPLKKDNKKLATAGMYVGGMKSNVAQGLDALKTNEIDELIEKNIDKVVDKKHKKLLWDKEGNRKMKDGKIKVMGSRKQKIELIEESNIEYTVEKRASLEESSKCDVLFATYQLVSEGTDIPTLNTLIMTSSRKEVEQIVGRIQRAKNAHKPMVLDICDMFSVYENQGKYRQRFYRSQEYHIDYIDYDATNTKELPIISDQEDKVDCNKLKGLKKIKKKSVDKEETTFNHKMLLELMDSDDE